MAQRNSTVARLRTPPERAAELTGGDAYRVNCCHTGTNPHNFLNGEPYADLELWGTVAYGPPRYTHMHAACVDSGDAAIHLTDMTITSTGGPCGIAAVSFSWTGRRFRK